MCHENESRVETEKHFLQKAEENKIKTSLLMNIFNTCRLFSRYGTMMSPYFLARNNKLSMDSLHSEQSLNRNSAFT